MVRKTVRVFARLKPSPDPSDAEAYRILYKKGCQDIVFKTNQNPEYGFYRNTTLKYRFYSILDQNSTQIDSFNAIAEPVINSVLQGYNGTIFAYGQTGSGKTYSITGDSKTYENRGIIPRTIEHVFEQIEKDHTSIHSVYISYMEIYNESAYDLLNPKHSATDLENLPKIVLLEDSKGEVHLRNLSVVPVASGKEATNLLFMGDTNRTIAETPMNICSSRSHCIFTLHIANSEIGGGRVRAKLHLVDLAGSERVKKTHITGKLLNSSKQINLSLHYLEQVILALSEGRKHVPYRNSTMTTVLRDSLGGNCITVMIANISIDSKNFQETISTCKFAQRVAMVSTEVAVNEESDPQQEIAALKLEIDNLKRQLDVYRGANSQEKLTADEIDRCKSAVVRYVDNVSADLKCDGDMRKAQLYFQLLRNMVHSNQKDAFKSGEMQKLHLAAEKHENQLKEKEDEIARLSELLNKRKQPNEKNELFAGASREKEAFGEFCGRPDCRALLAPHAAALRQRRRDARDVARTADSCRRNIEALKEQLDRNYHHNSEDTQQIIARLKSQQALYSANVLRLQQLRNEAAYLNHGYEQTKIRLLKSFKGLQSHAIHSQTGSQGRGEPSTANSDGPELCRAWHADVQFPNLQQPKSDFFGEHLFDSENVTDTSRFHTDHDEFYGYELLPAEFNTPFQGVYSSANETVQRDPILIASSPRELRRDSHCCCSHNSTCDKNAQQTQITRVNNTRADLSMPQPSYCDRQRDFDHCRPEKLVDLHATKTVENNRAKQTEELTQNNCKPQIHNGLSKTDANVHEILKGIPLTGDPEVDDEIVAFYKAKLNVLN